MADKYTMFGTLIILGITYPGMLTAWWLLFPDQVERARQRITEAPRKSFGVGAAAAGLAAIPGAVFFALPSQFTQVLGWVWLGIILGLASLGAAGIAAEIGSRLNQRNEVGFTALGAFLRGAVIWELASGFPVIGWLLVIPVGVLISLGGALFAVLRRMPKPKVEIETA